MVKTKEKIPKGKLKCPVCKKIKRKKCFKWNNVKNKFLCNQCDRKIGHNKFYIPNGKRLQGITKWNISDREKNVLHSNYMAQGMDSSSAWKRVYHHINILRQNANRWKGLQTIRNNRKLRDKQEKSKINKKFKESLWGK